MTRPPRPSIHGQASRTPPTLHIRCIQDHHPLALLASTILGPLGLLLGSHRLRRTPGPELLRLAHHASRGQNSRYRGAGLDALGFTRLSSANQLLWGSGLTVTSLIFLPFLSLVFLPSFFTSFSSLFLLSFSSFFLLLFLLFISPLSLFTEKDQVALPV